MNENKQSDSVFNNFSKVPKKDFENEDIDDEDINNLDNSKDIDEPQKNLDDQYINDESINNFENNNDVPLNYFGNEDIIDDPKNNHYIEDNEFKNEVNNGGIDEITLNILENEDINDGQPYNQNDEDINDDLDTDDNIDRTLNDHNDEGQNCLNDKNIIYQSLNEREEDEDLNLEQLANFENEDINVKRYKDDHSNDMDTEQMSANLDNYIEKKSEKTLDMKLFRFPISRIKFLMKCDPNISVTNMDSVLLIGKSAELFISYITKKIYSYTMQGKRKTIQKIDFDSVINNLEEFSFLEGIFDT